jgi:hypothetical protein
LSDGFLNPKFHFLKANLQVKNTFLKFFTTLSDFNYQENFVSLAKTYFGQKVENVEVLNFFGTSNINTDLIVKGFSGLNVVNGNYYTHALEKETESSFESIFEQKETQKSQNFPIGEQKVTFFVLLDGYLNRLQNPYQGLSEIYEKMKNSDFLWLDFELATENQAIIKDHYYRENNLFGWLTNTLNLVGFDKSLYKLKVAQNKDLNEYSVFAQWKKDIDFNWLENSSEIEVSLKESQKMILEQVKLYTFPQIQEILSKSGFEIKQSYLNLNNTKVDILVQKSKVSSNPEILYEI